MTYIPPMTKRVMRPALVFPLILKLLRKGTGSAKIKVSRHMLLEACAIQVAKNSSASLLPQPTHLPGRSHSQFFAIGVHDSSANMPKLNPQQLTNISIAQVAFRARSERPSNRRRNWVRIEILMHTVLIQ